jgi:hypothetical protein
MCININAFTQKIIALSYLLSRVLGKFLSNLSENYAVTCKLFDRCWLDSTNTPLIRIANIVKHGST